MRPRNSRYIPLSVSAPPPRVSLPCSHSAPSPFPVPVSLFGCATAQAVMLRSTPVRLHPPGLTGGAPP